jgi:hypothetical protein
MSLRLWARFRDSLWGWDDLFVLLAGIASIVGDSFVCLSEYTLDGFYSLHVTNNSVPGDGLGLHLWTLGYDKLGEYFRVNTARRHTIFLANLNSMSTLPT